MQVRNAALGIATGSILAWLVTATAFADSQNLANEPLFLGDPVKPPIMVMLDSSGSMKAKMYPGGFDPNQDYYGMFDANASYEYDKDIPINTGAYNVDVEESKKGAFVEASCTPSASNDCWDGNFLNWLVTRRIDASREVMVGGKWESASAFDYDEDGDTNTDSGDLNYKKVGNNEPEDSRSPIQVSDGSSADYSPVPDGRTVTVSSPAAQNNGAQQAEYAPYAQITYQGGGGGSGGTLIRDNSGNVVGEFGEVSFDGAVSSANQLDSGNWTQVNFSQPHPQPRVVAKSLSFNGSNPAFVRIRNVTTTGFELQVQEWDDDDGNHTTETVTWTVIEEGRHTLPNGIDVEAGRINTDKLYFSGHSPNQFEQVNFSTGFPGDPVVMASVTTYNDISGVTARIWADNAAKFKVAMQEEESNANTGHSAENIDWIAFEEGDIEPSDFSNPDNGFTLEAGSQSGIDDSDNTVSFDSAFDSTPFVMTALQTLNGEDTSVLRQKSVSPADFTVFVEEEPFGDNETNHTDDEYVGYVALSSAQANLNVALAVKNKPSGLLQDISDQARLGVSFYRYDPKAGNIYEGENAHGGTLQFKIPKNPFVKEPTANQQPGKSHVKGYRKLEGYVGTDMDKIVDAVQHYPLVWGTTPLAENLWEVTQYWEQDSPFYDSKDPISGARKDFVPHDVPPTDQERDPLYYPKFNKTLSCAKPSTLLFTDGVPFRDAYIPSSVVDYDDDNASGDERNTNDNSNEGQDNLDDVAYWGFCDKGQSGCDPTVPSGGTRDLRPALDGDQFQSIWTVAFAGNSIPQILQDTADNAGGEAYAAEDGKALESAFDAALQAVVSNASFSAVAANTGSVSGSTRIYQAVFDSSDWSGDLKAFPLNLTTLNVQNTPAWKASSQLPSASNRDIMTFDQSDNANGIDFVWSQLTASQKTTLNNNPALLHFLRGDQSNEGNDPGDFRQRSTPLGDIVHSSPVFVEGDGSTPPMVYVGANDGMLHGFNANTGEEEFAYIPGEVFSDLPALANQNYTHQYYVDGSPAFAQQYYQREGKRRLVGGLRAGGQGVFALDVGNPQSMSPGSDVLWEFTDADDADMGLSYSKPVVVKLESGDWAAVFGNGYNNAASDGTAGDGTAVLYIVDIETGNLIRRIDTGSGSTSDVNGLSSPAVVDLDGNGKAERAYAGDINGNLWRFDLSGGTATKVFKAEDADGDAQPITVKPQVAKHPQGKKGPMVYFGTGKYLTNGDNAQSGQDTQSFYGIWDQGTQFDRGQLLQQKIVKEEQKSVTDANTGNTIDARLRTTSDNEISTWYNGSTGKGGWYIDLKDPDTGDNRGERVINRPSLRGDRVIFTTLIPSDDPCAAGGTSWLMELNKADGSRLENVAFDVNNDQQFDNTDNTSDGDVASGLQRKGGDQGIYSGDQILDTPKFEVKVISTSSGEIQTTPNNSSGTVGRQSWQELR